MKSDCHPVCSEHEWQPLSFVFETQMLDSDGRVVVRQPDLQQGRVYCVCMKCHKHTYIVTSWVGYYEVAPHLLDDEGNDRRVMERLGGT